jgi:hypothetical protein
MTPQEVFDTVATHLLKQNARAILSDVPEAMCAYKAGDLECAAGCLIPGNLYDPEMETNCIHHVFAKWPEVADEICYENLHLVERLQYLHDNREPEEWSYHLRDVAEDFDLSTKVLPCPTD